MGIAIHQKVGSNIQAQIAIAATGEHVSRLNTGQTITFVVEANAGATYDVIYYLFTEEDLASRKKHVEQSGLTGPVSLTARPGIVEMGVEFSVAPTSEFNYEIAQGKQ